MGDCSKHKKDICGVSDMEKLAEMIGDLHYETLSQLLANLGDKLNFDANKDDDAGRHKLAKRLFKASESILDARGYIDHAWRISRPFMNPTLCSKGDCVNIAVCEGFCAAHCNCLA